MENVSEADKVVRRRLYDNLAEVVQVMSAPARLKIIQNLSNRPCSVENLSILIDETIGNTSQHLQKLLKARLVRCEKEGVSRIYYLANEKILDVWLSLQSLASAINPEVEKDENEVCPKELLPDEDLKSVIKQVKLNHAVLVDVRVEEEAVSTPVNKALNIPARLINKKIEELPKNKTIYVFCRGKYCGAANPVVSVLRKKGYKAYRLIENFYQINEQLNS